MLLSIMALWRLPGPRTKGITRSTSSSDCADADKESKVLRISPTSKVFLTVMDSQLKRLNLG
jgi:hypothetical protein